MIQVNAIGDACPLPVVKTKKALGGMASGTLEVLVDNEIAVQNIRRFADNAGCLFEVAEQDNHFRILIEKTEDALREQAPVDGKTAVGEWRRYTGRPAST